MLTASAILAMLLTNGPEILGTVTGVGGALMLAMKNRFSPWAWPVWIVSNIAWILWSVSISAYGALFQQVIFLVINLIGTYQWLGSVNRGEILPDAQVTLSDSPQFVAREV